MSKILTYMKKTSNGLLDNPLTVKTINRIYSNQPASGGIEEELEHLANSLINMHSGPQGSVIVFASTARREGTSFISYNTARALSNMLDGNIAWVDGNFRSPDLDTMGLPLNFQDLLQDPSNLPPFHRGAGLVRIGNGMGRMNVIDQLKGEPYLRLLERLKREFTFVIIDAPPVLESVEVFHLAKPALGLVLVVECQRLKYEVIKAGLDLLASHNVKVLGTALNKRSYHLPEVLYRRL